MAINPVSAARVVLLVCVLSGHAAWAGPDMLQQAQAAAQTQQYARAQGLLQAWLLDHPLDNDARFLLARVLSWQKLYDAAYVEYDRLLGAAPEDVDYLLGKARTLVWDGRPRESLPLLSHARRLRPEYEDVWRAEIEALSAAGGDSQRQEAERLRQEAQARFPRSPWTSAAFETAGTAGGNPVAPPLPAAGSARATQVEAGYAYEGLSNGYADWRSSYLWTDHVYGERKVIYGVLRQTQRFDLRDREIRAGMSYPLAERWTATLEAGASPDHNVLPKRSLTGELAHSYTAGWGVSAGLTRTQYDTVRSDSGRVGVERYIADFRLAYTVSLARLQGNGSATTHKLQAAYYYSARSNLAIALVTGQEVSSEPAGVVTTDVRSVTLNGLHWFQPRWAVSYEFLTHRQGDSYTRKGVQIGLRHVF